MILPLTSSHMDAAAVKPGGIYVHVPFCKKKCVYCDFYSVTNLADVPVFLEALKREMKMAGHTGQLFDTLYIGGGTPSVLTADDVSQIIGAALKHFNLALDCEITLEVNPATVTLDDLRAYRKSGINRLSIGIQSFDDQNLRFLGRIHSGGDAILCFDQARQAGFDNLGLDLIYGLPGQDITSWLGDLNLAVEIEPQHLSCYMLTCESATPLNRAVKAGKIHLAAEGLVRKMFDTTIDFLTSCGFLHYEISNFAKLGEDGKRASASRHNLKYWSFAPYIGFGPSAHSFREPQRFWNLPSLAKYVSRIEAGQSPMAKKEILTREQMMMEAIYLGFRTTRGVDLDGFQNKFGANFSQCFAKITTELEARGMIQIRAGHCALTRRGLPFLDSIAGMFISQMIS